MFQPENIVCSDNAGKHIKIIDFGAAKVLNPTKKVFEDIFSILQIQLLLCLHCALFRRRLHVAQLSFWHQKLETMVMFILLLVIDQLSIQLNSTQLSEE